MKEIEQIPFLTRQECELVRNKVLGLLPAWRKLKWPGSRGKAPFYILGYSIFSCRRNANRMREYRRGCSKLNPLLEQEFSWIYARLKKLLARTLGAPVHFRKDASLPGFQILLNHSAFVQLSGHWHVDLDSTLLKWKEPLDYSQIRAFTLPVTLPQCGGSVDYLN
ncbi:MAG: hypothetical protein HY074_11140, partial [Deltaproteobacteria bacterium]|nr:hypothetical protein [Deltaproteobacteria bacterium]